MRKLFVLSIVALSSIIFVNAQESDKKWFLGGGLSLSAEQSYLSNGDEKNISGFTFNPTMGVFVSPRTAVGAGIVYDESKTKVDGTVSQHTEYFGLTPFVRRYWSLCEKVYIFGEASAPVLFGEDKVSKTDITKFGVKLTPGLSVKLTNSFLMEASYNVFNMTISGTSPDSGKGTTNISFAADSNNTLGAIKIGFKVLF